MWQADAILHLLGAVEPIDLHQQRRAALIAFGTHVQAGQALIATPYLDPLAVLERELDAFTKDGLKACVQRCPALGVAALDTLGGQIISGGAAELVARG